MNPFVYAVCFIFLGLTLQAQEVEVVQLKKDEVVLYQGVLKETRTWYVGMDQDRNYYLFNVDKPADEIYAWFSKFQGSQNIYKARLESSKYRTLQFSKENDPLDRLTFYFERTENKGVSLTNIETAEVFIFERVIK